MQKIIITSLILGSLTISAQDQNQDLVFGNNKFIYFKNADGNEDGVRLGRHTGNALRLKYGGNSFMFDALDNRPVVFKNSSDQSKILIHPAGDSFFNGGNLGIGKKNPNSKLHVFNGSSGITPHDFSDLTIEDDNHVMVSLLSPNDKVGYYGFGDTNDDFVGGVQYNHAINEMRIRVNNHSSDVVIKSNGNVGIGTTSTGTHKLAVDGTIGAREIKVEATGWSDFVFSNDYQLPSLDEVEKFIAQNNHLPEIPSEAEVLEEGINLGEMNAKLLQKIEELTLYTINQQKLIETQGKMIEELNSIVRKKR